MKRSLLLLVRQEDRRNRRSASSKRWLILRHSSPGLTSSARHLPSEPGRVLAREELPPVLGPGV